jgi:hypothetical protein
MKFAYTRRGGPLLDWSGPTAPYQTRAGETRSLGEFYPTTRTSSAMRRYGARSAGHSGAAVNYEHSRSLGALDVPRPGAPEVVSGYESPQPGAAIIHLGGYIPEGAVRSYGQQFLGADPEPSTTSKVQDLIYSPIVKKAAVIASAYHGVKRHNGSVLWGLLWAIGAYLAPVNGVSAVAFAAAQGFGQRKLTSNPARKRKKRPGRKRPGRTTMRLRRKHSRDWLAQLQRRPLPGGTGVNKRRKRGKRIR